MTSTIANAPSNEQAAEIAKREHIKNLRLKIKQQAGDHKAILGTTADATQFLLHALCTLTTKLNNANSLADVRAATADLEPTATAFLAKVQSGTVKLTFMVKGLDNVVNDIETRATAVADILQNLKTGEAS